MTAYAQVTLEIREDAMQTLEQLEIRMAEMQSYAEVLQKAIQVLVSIVGTEGPIKRRYWIEHPEHPGELLEILL